MQLSRRKMITGSAMLVGGAMAARSSLAADSKQRKFTMSLRGGSIGVKADLAESIKLASQFGFEAVTPDASYLSKLDSGKRAELLADMKTKSLTWGAAGLPGDFRKDEATFRNGAQNLPKLAKAMQQAGVIRVGTWISPSHDELTYVANFRQHARRLREFALILQDHGQTFGLEYVGPKTSWTAKRYSFVHSMREANDLIAEINVPNVGLVLDSWHWYTAHESVDDLKTLKNENIVACDLNDAPKGLEIDQQMDLSRELPMATGVINLKAFLQTLVEIGYDGPIRAEPFNKPLNAMENEAAVEATAKSMKAAFALL